MATTTKSGRNHSTSRRCLTLAFMAMALFFLISFQNALYWIEEHHDAHVAQKVIDHPVMISHKIGTEPLEHEVMFTDTLKSCLPREKGEACKTYVAESTERIGVLAPPGSMTSSILNLLHLVIRHASKMADGSKVPNIEIIPTSHVPPYGYGKTHGYTRLIRVVPEPLLVGATDSLLGALYQHSLEQQMHNNNNREDNTAGNTIVTLNDIKASLRLQIRYHCRLNHISAHTALWTIGVEEVAELQEEELIGMIQEFLDLELDEGVIEQIMEDEMKGNFEEQNPMSKLDAMFAKGALLLSVVQSMNRGQSVLQILDEVLLEEMKISKNLTAWPCESFWTVGEKENRLDLSPLITRLSHDLSPNCSAPFTSCFVERDKCEYHGDGQCAKQMAKRR